MTEQQKQKQIPASGQMASATNTELAARLKAFADKGRRSPISVLMTGAFGYYQGPAPVGA